MNTLSRIEDKFDKKFTMKDDELIGLHPLVSEHIKSFYRHQILALIEELEAGLPTEERSCRNCDELTSDVNCPYCGCGIFKIKNRFIRLSDVKTILDNYKKEIQK